MDKRRLVSLHTEAGKRAEHLMRHLAVSPSLSKRESQLCMHPVRCTPLCLLRHVLTGVGLPCRGMFSMYFSDATNHSFCGQKATGGIHSDKEQSDPNSKQFVTSACVCSRAGYSASQ